MILTFIKLHSQEKYAVAVYPTPVLNMENFESVFGGSDGVSIKTDKEGLIREMEYIALQGTVFEIISTIEKSDHYIYKVVIEDYQYGNELYIDSRFVELKKDKPISPEKKLPSKEEIYKFLDRAVASNYCWGGNYLDGIEQMLKYYPPKGTISQETEAVWKLQGVDCSGLMYQATNGYTERNTSKLINFGDAVEIEGLNAEEILNKLEPLDMMVWIGHVIYVYDNTTAIQSSLSKGGVVKTDLLGTLKSIMHERKPVNDYSSGKKKRFVVRRWFK